MLRVALQRLAVAGDCEIGRAEAFLVDLANPAVNRGLFPWLVGDALGAEAALVGLDDARQSPARNNSSSNARKACASLGSARNRSRWRSSRGVKASPRAFGGVISRLHRPPGAES